MTSYLTDNKVSEYKICCHVALRANNIFYEFKTLRLPIYNYSNKRLQPQHLVVINTEEKNAL